MSEDNLTSTFPTIRCSSSVYAQMRQISRQLKIGVGTLIRACVHDLLNDPDPQSRLIMSQARKVVQEDIGGGSSSLEPEGNNEEE